MCDMFVCDYINSCIVGIYCQSGVHRDCKLPPCSVCQFRGKCKGRQSAQMRRAGKVR